MKKERFFVTFHRLTPSGRTNHKAIECKNSAHMYALAMELAYIPGVRNVRTNSCGIMKKGTTIIPYEDYKNGTWKIK